MLKPYVERGRDPVLPPVNVNVLVSKPNEDLGSELNSSSFGPTDTATLTDTDVLRNLDSKLSHPSSSQVTVVGALLIYLFLNQMEVTDCVPTIES